MESLVLFARAPVLGRVKTRLSKERGEREAILLYTAFLRDVATVCANWRDEDVAVDPNRRLVLYVEPHGEDPLLAEIARLAGARVVPQVGEDLGAKLRHIFDAEFARGARSVCAVGSDSPTLPRHLIDHAFRSLAWERVALGPSFDGGYWLVGAQRPAPEIFSDIPWSTPSVLNRTVAQLRGQGVRPYLLPFWYDVDEPSDLEPLVWHLRTLRERDASVGAATWEALVRIGLVREGAGQGA
jgi:uncharacterized protein